MKNLQWIATKEDEGIRLDAFLSQKSGETRSRIQNLIKDGCAAVNGGAPKKAGQPVSAGDAIALDIPDPAPLEAVPVEMDVPIVYEDEDIVVVNKPRNLVTHPAAGHAQDTLVNALLYHCGDSLSGVGGERRPGIVHRIDRDTSGLIIAAKNDAAHQYLSAQLADHTLARTYECIVVGSLREDRGTVDAPIARHPADRKRMAVVAGGREAVTHWEVIARYPGYTHVRCKLETGRTHQIRVHLAWRNHPILGDTVYGHKKPELGQSSQCLHARELTFVHPRTGERMTVRCELPDYFTALLEKLRARA